MVLGDVEETVTTVEIDEETYEEIYKVSLYLFLYIGMDFSYDLNYCCIQTLNFVMLTFI